MRLRSLCILFFSCVISLHAASKSLESVSLQLQWLDQFQFAGYYMAIEKGFYRDAGLNVTLKPFQYGLNPTEEVVEGRADYGVGRSSLLIDRINGKPVVALAAIFQSSPNVLLARKDSGITGIKDFKGKRVMLTRDAQDGITYQAMFNAEGITFNDILWQEHSFRLDDLIEKRTDLMASYLSNEPFRMNERGIETVGFAPKDYGFDFYSDILFTSEREIREHPERAEAFLMASVKGWEYAFEHIEETADIIFRRYNGQEKSKGSLIYEGRILKTLAYSGEKPLGHIAIDKFETVYNLYRVMGKISHPLENIDGFIYRSVLNAPLELTADEQSFLRLHRIRAASTGFGPPFKHDPFSHNGYPLTALAYDLWSRIVDMRNISSEMLHLRTPDDLFEALAAKRVDVILYMDMPPDRFEGIRLSKPYASFSYVIATRGDIGYIPELSALNGRKVAVRASAGVIDTFKTEHPEIDVVAVKTADEGLDLLVEKRVDAVMDLLAILTHVIQHGGDNTVRISGTTPYSQSLHFAVREDYPELLSIIDKSIDAIPPHRRNELMRRYVPDTGNAIDYPLFIKILLAVLVVIGGLLYRHYVLGRHNRELLAMANTDKLTQTSNRLRLDQFLEDLVVSYRRYKRPFALILLDIDDFKTINDRFGHLVGDQALQALAAILKNHLRQTDIIGRWGGEEFMIICPETDADGGVKLAEALRTITADKEIDGIGQISCSFGVSAMLETDTVESIIKRVDDAMYRAKHMGKNRVVFL